jgi:predicted DNA-binding transcriptional regulator AlpA
VQVKFGDRSMPVDKQQFQLPLTMTKCRPQKLRPPQSEMREPRPRDPVAGIDQVLSTRDVERITGRHRCTIYRWVCAGTFPEKRAGGGRGWLRSEVELWLQGGGSGRPTPPGRTVPQRRFNSSGCP